MADSELSNWGRWGDDDQRGTLNLITAEHIRETSGLLRRGKVYSLALLLDKDSPVAPIRNPLWHRTSTILRPSPQHSAADDVIVMHTHGATHVDALCHIFTENQMYNGHRVDETIHPTTGSAKNGIHNMGSLVGRGVLLDIAAYRGVDHLGKTDGIGPDELDSCAKAQGVKIRSGDIVLVRTGWIKVFDSDRALFDSGSPGPTAEVAAWFERHEICALGADNTAVEVYDPSSKRPLSLHIDVIRNLGGYMIEFLNLEELAADRVYEFMFVAAPLRLVNGIGSPINPLAIC